MKISQDKFVALTYKLTVDGEVIESMDAERPLSFVFGHDQVHTGIETNLEGKEAGAEFAFVLTPENAYGEYIEDAVVVLPKNLFEVDGKINEDLLFEGNQLPMMDNDGNRMIGRIAKLTEDSVTMDFNHPMAGKTMEFEGKIIEVREATEEEINPPQSCGCGCSGSCDEGDCGSSCDSGCCQ